MTPPDFISIYFPEIGSLDAVTLAETRARIVTYMQEKYPDLDMRPNSVFGDLVINPFTYLLASFEIGHGHFMSDLDLENVAQGIVYNCEFVSKYLNNFGGVSRSTLQSSGVIRLVFCDDTTYEVNRSTRFKFGDDEFSLRLPHIGNLEIKPVGSTPTPYANSKILAQISDDRYAVDIGVIGTMTEQIEAGATAELNTTITDLDAVYAVIDFEFGLPPTSLAELAKKTRETFYSATLTTRSGTQHFIKKEFPDIVAASPVINGDTEAIRATVNPLGIAAGKMDLYAQSKGYANSDSQIVRIPYVADQGGPAIEKFIGKITFLNPPIYIESITYVGDETIDLGLGTAAIDIYSRSQNPTKAPMLTASYSILEDLWFAIDMPTDGGDPLITPDVDALSGDQSALFKITYKSDPLLPIVHEAVTSKNSVPVGVDVLARNFIPVIITSLEIDYTRKAGVTILLDQAKTEIYNYFRTLGHPNIFSTSRIIDAMYYAGADDVQDISVTAHVQWSVATKVLLPTSDELDVDFVTADSEALAPAALNISTTAGLRPTYIDPDLGTGDATYVVINSRNVGYYLEKDNITFNEIIN